MNGYNKAINGIYNYLYDAENPMESKQRLDKMVNFIIDLRHSYVDNDKPMSTYDVNMEILRQAELKSLKVCFVPIDGKVVGLKND